MANFHWIIEKSRKFQKNIFTDYTKPFIVWITTDCGIFLEIGIPDYLTCLLRNLYAGQEATVRTRHEIDWFNIGKEVRQGFFYVKAKYCHLLI